jgi:TRAP-type C4-dicarboxylate transport system substrate-binding protein
MINKKIQIIFLVLFFSVGSFSIELSTQKYKLKWILAHEPARVFEKAAKEFASRISEKTNGRVVVEIVDAKNYKSQHLSTGEAFKLVQSGELQMSQTYTTFLGSFNKKMWILDLPFLFKNHEHASAVLDGKIGSDILAGLGSAGVSGLAFTYSGGYRIIPTSKVAIRKIEDFKGLSIGVAKDSPVAQAYLKQLGANPVSVQDVALDDANGDGFETTYARFSNVQTSKMKYLNETEHTLFLTGIVINKKFLESLPKDIQKSIVETAKEVAKFERTESIADNLNSKNELVSKFKMEVVHLPTAEVDKMKDVSKKVYELYSKVLDKKLISAIQNTNPSM